MFEKDFITNKPRKYNTFKSFKYAFQGVFFGFKSEKNLWLQILIGVSSMLFFLHNGKISFAIISIILMMLVSSLELMNTAFEHLCDLVDTEYNEQIKKIKDVAAGSVFYASLGWLIAIIYGVFAVFFGI